MGYPSNRCETASKSLNCTVWCKKSNDELTSSFAAVAEQAQESIERRSTDCSDPWGATLSNEYSNFNVLEFLRRYLERDRLQYLHWTGRAQLSSASLECLLPDGIWEDMQVEDLVHRTIDWQQLGPDPAQGNGGNTLCGRMGRWVER